MTALELTPEGQLRVMPLTVVQELIDERNQLREALRVCVWWAESISRRVTEDRESINWTGLQQARKALADMSDTPSGAGEGLGASPVRHIDLADKESIVELMFSVQSGHTSCRRAASDIQAQHLPLRDAAKRLHDHLWKNVGDTADRPLEIKAATVEDANEIKELLETLRLILSNIQISNLKEEK